MARKKQDQTADILSHARYVLTQWLTLHQEGIDLFKGDSNKQAWYKTSEKSVYYGVLNSMKYFGLIDEFSAMGITIKGILYTPSEVAEFCKNAGL